MSSLGKFYETSTSQLAPLDKAGLRHPASAAHCARLAGRCPNNDSLFPPLAAVVVVAPTEGTSGEERKLTKCQSLPSLGEVALRSNDGEVFSYFTIKS